MDKTTYGLAESLGMLLDRLDEHGTIDSVREEGPIEDARHALEAHREAGGQASRESKASAESLPRLINRYSAYNKQGGELADSFTQLVAPFVEAAFQRADPIDAKHILQGCLESLCCVEIIKRGMQVRIGDTD